MQDIINWFNDILGDGFFRKIIFFALIIVAGLIIIRIVITLVKKALAKSKLEKAAHSLIMSVVRVVLYAMLSLIAASSLGIDVTGIVALASVASLAVSLALQNSLANIIGGFTIINTHPFQSGDWVEIAGQSGEVKEVGMAYTKLLTADNKLVQIPNANVVASEIVNYTATGKRRVDINVSASYDAPLDKVLTSLKEAGAVKDIIPEEGVFTAVTGYGDHAISYVVRVWAPSDKYWDVLFEITQRVKELFDRDGIEMTYPHLNVHINK